MNAELHSQQQNALAAAAQAKTEREREAHQSVAAAERASVAVAEERGARLAAEQRLGAAQVAHVDQVRAQGRGDMLTFTLYSVSDRTAVPSFGRKRGAQAHCDVTLSYGALSWHGWLLPFTTKPFV